MKKILSVLLSLAVLVVSLLCPFVSSAVADEEYIVWKQGDGNTFSHFSGGGFSTNDDKTVLTYDPSTRNGLSHACLWGDDAHKITSLVGKTFRLSMDITMLECVEETEGIGIVGSRDRGATSDVYWPEALYNIGWIGNGNTQTICTTFTVTDIGSANYLQFSCKSNSKFEIRNIILAELVGTVEAKTASEAKGSATVANTTTYYKGTTGWTSKNHYPFKTDVNEYAVGEKITFSATPNSGYEFEAWKDAAGNTVSTTSTYVTAVTGDLSLTAHFKASSKYIVWKQGDGNTFSHFWNGGFSTNDDKSVLTYDPATRTNLSYVCLWGDDAHKITDLDGKTFRLSMDITMINCVEETEGIGIVGSPNRSAGSEIWWPEHLYNIGWIGNGNTQTICTTFTVSDMEYLNYLLFTCKSKSKFEIRNIVLSELVETVEANTNNPAFGSATVANTTTYYKGTTGWSHKNHYPFKTDAKEYAVGETVTFTATPNKGREFVAWKDQNGEVVSTDAVYTTTVEDDISLTAYFEKINNAEFTVSVDVDNIAGIAKGGNVLISDGSSTADSFTVLEGKELTLIAKPFEGYEFVGWFANGSPAATSTEANYTFKVDLDAVFTGVFKKSENTASDNLNLINDGNFSSTDPNTSGKIKLIKENNAVVYEDGREWFNHGGTAKVIAEDGNKYVSMANSGYVMQTVKLENNKEYVLQFKARSTDVNGLVARFYGLGAGEHNINNEPYGEIQYEVYSGTVVGDGNWHSYSITLNPTELKTEELIVYIARTMSPMDIDDIALYEMNDNICSVSTTAFRGGSADIDGPTIVSKGDKVTFVATPNEGDTFLGWYVVGKSYDGFISTEATFTTAVMENTTLMAVFGGDRYADTTYDFLNGGAELGDTTNWEEHYIGEGSDITVNDEEKHSGKYSFQVDFEGARQGVAPTDAILLRAKHEYTFTAYFKIDREVNGIVEIMPSISTAFPYKQGKTELKNLDIKTRTDMPMTIYVSGDQSPRNTNYSAVRIDPTNTAYLNEAEKNDGWYKFEYTVTVPITYDCTVVYFGLRANMKDSTVPARYYLDDFSVTETEIDYSTRRTDETYCDNLYNELELSKTNMPKGFAYSDGTINVTANSGALVIPVEAEYLIWYHLGYSTKSANEGTSYVGVTFSDPTGGNFADPQSLGITSFNIIRSNDWLRDGFKYFAETKEEKAWIVIYGGSNAFSLSNICLFKSKYGNVTDINAVSPEKYDYDGMGIVTDDYDLKWAEYIGISDNSPATGDSGIVPAVVALIASVMLFTLLLISRKKEVH